MLKDRPLRYTILISIGGNPHGVEVPSKFGDDGRPFAEH